MIEDSLRGLKEQLLWQPQIQNAEKLKAHRGSILCGMGGSRIAAGFLKTLHPEMDIEIWNDYDLPTEALTKAGLYQDSMVIVSSYSGNTEEAIGNFYAASEAGLNVGVITGGGKLLDLARENGAPYILLPGAHLPRMAAGYHIKALIAMLGENHIRDEIEKFANENDFALAENIGKAIGESLSGTTLIYSSRNNRYLAEYFKISLNETAKLPAFSNVLPEFAHNELSGLPEESSFILINDSNDHPRIQIKMSALEILLKEKGFKVFNIHLAENLANKIFTTYAIAGWVALYAAKKNNINSEEQEIIEEFKKKVL